MRLGHWDAVFGISGDMALASALDAGASLDAVNAALGAVGVPGLRVELSRTERGGIACARAEVRWEGDGEARTPAGPGRPGAQGATFPRGPASELYPPHASDRDRDPGPAHAHAHPHAGAGDCDQDDGRTHARGDAYPADSHAAGAHAHGQEGHPLPGGSGHHVHRTFADVRRLLSPLPAPVRERALAVFARLAEAEGTVHGRPADTVHFHEVGGEDAIGDVVGTCAALVDLGVDALTVSPLPAGGGTVRAAHGELPVPAPAVAVLLRGYDVVPGPVAAELVTPTGAALVTALACPAAGWPAMRVANCGWGAGTRDFPDHPNACRLVWGEGVASPPASRGGWPRERLIEMETHIDDQSPEGVGHLFERLLGLGALDVAVSALGMKKQRPGIRLWALLRPELAEAAARCLFTESTALGLRVREVERWSLPRRVVRVTTPYGEVGVKLGCLDGEVVNAAPEYEDCRRLATEAGVPLKAVMAAAVRAAPWPAAPL